jgi:hypothetical protein
MRKALLTLATTAAILTAPTLVPAQAMPVGNPAGIQAALDETSAVQDVATVCRHRAWSSKRRCWWRPGYRGWRWHRRRW